MVLHLKLKEALKKKKKGLSQEPFDKFKYRLIQRLASYQHLQLNAFHRWYVRVVK